MDRVHFSRSDESKLKKEIAQEFGRLYHNKYGNRNPTTLSTLELDQLKTEAGKRVQDKRKGRLIP